MPEKINWWRDGEALQRFVGDLIGDELGRIRPGSALCPHPRGAGLSLVENGLACDSLELLSLAAAIVETFQMYRSGFENQLLARHTLGDWTDIIAAALTQFSSELTFRTSGSTGSPKPCDHTLQSLDQEICGIAHCFPGRRRLICAVPAHHIYGFLFSVLLPQYLKLPVVDVRGGQEVQMARVLRAGDLVIGYPEFWSTIIRTVPIIPADVVGVTSTAPCPDNLMHSAVNHGLTRLIDVYGSSETAGIGLRDNPDRGYRLFSYWERSADGRSLRRTLPDGQEICREVPDRITWTDDRFFRLNGRADNVVQVGGINVFPDAISRRLCEHPSIAEAAVRLMRQDEGARLKAFIVPADNQSDMARLSVELTMWCNIHLSTPERPKAFTFGKALPARAHGKLADWPIM
jgi:4-coumarate--CoA ligase (photoactive yellow protein activation family)